MSDNPTPTPEPVPELTAAILPDARIELRGFNKSQIIDIENGQKALKVWSPLNYEYEGLGLPKGTILKDYEDTGDFVNTWCVLAMHPDGTPLFYRLNRPGGYGSWQYLTVHEGSIAFKPADDVSYSFLCS